MNVEEQAQKALSDMGFPEVEFKGREPYRGGERLLYALPNGDAVMDGPVLVINGNNVEVRPWFDILQ